MKARTPYFLSEIGARTFVDRGSRVISHGFLNQVFAGKDLRARASGYVSSAYDFSDDPLIEGGAFSFKTFLTSYCPSSEAFLIREASLIYVRQVNEAAKLISQRTPPVAMNIMAMQADVDFKAMRRLDTLLLRRRQPELVSASEMLADFRSLSRVFR